jgi:hypothetical protein
MHPDLEAAREEFAESRRRGSELLDTLSPEQLNWRPAPAAWSVAECIEHLSITSNMYAPEISAAIRKGPRGSGVDAVRYGWLESYFIKTLEPPVGMKFKAPKTFAPKPDLGVDALRRHWNASHDRIVELMAQCEGVALDKAKVQSPVSKWMKTTLGACFRVINAHERRHLWQAEQVRAHPEFPKAIREAGSRS